MSERHPNLLPAGWREISESEFAKSMFFTYTGEQSYGGTMYPPSADDPTKPDFSNRDNVVHGAKLFTFHDGTGVGLTRDYWKGTVSYFWFGCEHNYRELPQAECRDRNIYHPGRCYHVSECGKCGYINAYDTSD